LKHKKLADKAFESHKTAIDAIITEELGIDKEELGGSGGGNRFPLFYFQLVHHYTLYPFMF
jgi:hypothetical protein